MQGGTKPEMSINPMRKAHAAPRCTAKSKRTGERAAVHRWANGMENYKHGARSKESVELWKLIKLLSQTEPLAA